MARGGGSASTLQWRFQFAEVADVRDLGLNEGITAVHRTVMAADMFPRMAYHCSRMLPKQYYTLVLMEGDDEYIYAIDCTVLKPMGDYRPWRSWCMTHQETDAQCATSASGVTASSECSKGSFQAAKHPPPQPLT